MLATKKHLDELTYEIIGCAIEVPKQIGLGLLESVYEKCFSKELQLQEMAYQNQVWVPLEYKGLELDAELRLDVLIEDLICVELKAQDCRPFMMLYCFHTWKCYTSQRASSLISIV
jgi:GxxExxY protein